MMQLAGATIIQPLKLLNIRVPEADFVREVENSIDAINELRKSTTPLQYLDSFHRLLDSSYPIQLVRSLSLLGDYRQLPRSIHFYTSSSIKGTDSEDTKKAKEQFRNINLKVVRSKRAFPKPFQSQEINKKLNSFNPNTFQDFRPRPSLSKISVTRTRGKVDPRYLIELDVNQVNPKSKMLYVYVKFEQSGSINIGRLHLSERVLKLSPKFGSFGRSSKVSFFLNGPLSPFKSAFLDAIVSFGGDFNMDISLSEDSDTWSRVKVIGIRMNEEEFSFL